MDSYEQVFSQSNGHAAKGAHPHPSSSRHLAYADTLLTPGDGNGFQMVGVPVRGSVPCASPKLEWAR